MPGAAEPVLGLVTTWGGHMSPAADGPKAEALGVTDPHSSGRKACLPMVKCWCRQAAMLLLHRQWLFGASWVSSMGITVMLQSALQVQEPSRPAHQRHHQTSTCAELMRGALHWSTHTISTASHHEPLILQISVLLKYAKKGWTCSQEVSIKAGYPVGRADAMLVAFCHIVPHKLVIS